MWRDDYEALEPAHREAMDSKPELWPWNVARWKAWCHLTRSRRAGFGTALPVPVSEVESYCRLRHPDFDVEERVELLELIAKLDEVYFKLNESKRARE